MPGRPCVGLIRINALARPFRMALIGINPLAVGHDQMII